MDDVVRLDDILNESGKAVGTGVLAESSPKVGYDGWRGMVVCVRSSNRI